MTHLAHISPGLALATVPFFPTEEDACRWSNEHPCGSLLADINVHVPHCGKPVEPIWLRGRGWCVPFRCCKCAGCTHVHDRPPETEAA